MTPDQREAREERIAICEADHVPVDVIAAILARDPEMYGSEDDDPSPYCQYCGAQRKETCTCGPMADND